ncbi:MAG: hypothetical protein IJ558_11620 [Treponema sp.]|nr:hypothetical protein [Treponema sp.]
MALHSRIGNNRDMTDSDKNFAVYSFIKDLALQKLSDEQERERNITDQSKNIQAVFSILSVALFTLLPILLEYVADKGKDKILTVVIIIVYAIVFSLLVIAFVCGSYIQIRKPKAGLPDIPTIKNAILKDYNDFSEKSSQIHSFIDTLIPLQKSITKINDANAKLVNISMKFILASVYFMVLFTVLIFEIWVLR